MSLKIRDLIKVNDKAAETLGVQLGWYTEKSQEAENLRLIENYIFSSGTVSPGARSAIDIFASIRDSLNTGGATTYNNFTVIAGYGHGKSHFALVLANYFGRSIGDPILEKILYQIENYTDVNTARLFRLFKEQTKKPQLVIPIAGHDVLDLRQNFLKALRRALNEHNEETRNYKLRSTSERAAEWLRSLSSENQQKAKLFLHDKYKTNLLDLTQALDNNEQGNEQQVALDLSVHLNNVKADFDADSSLQEIIQDVLNDLCTGINAPFQKMVILFDELGNYTEKWCKDRLAYGGLAPQQILEACDTNRGRLSLVGFLQRPFAEVTKDKNSEIIQEARKWTDRFLPQTTFRLESSLEQVIASLLNKKDNPEWVEFARVNRLRFEKVSREAWQMLLQYQKSEQWNINKFTEIVGYASFPLHPLATALLCNLDIAQDARSIVAVVTNEAQKIKDESPMLVNGDLRFIMPQFLVDEFANYFIGQEESFNLYQNAYDRLLAESPTQYSDILKALFLFKAGRLKLYEGQTHAQVLGQICGLKEAEANSILKDIEENYGTIRYSQSLRIYEFISLGATKIDVRKRAIEQIDGKRITSIAKTLENLQISNEKRSLFEGKQFLVAADFKSEYKVIGQEWQFVKRLLNANKLSSDAIKDLYEDLELNREARGLMVYLISDNTDELEDSRTHSTEILNELRYLNYPLPIILVVPDNPIRIEQELLIRDNLINGWSNELKEIFGQSYQDALIDSERRIQDIFDACVDGSVQYYIAEDVCLSLQSHEQRKPQRIASTLFSKAFPNRIPTKSNAMNPKSHQSGSIVSEVARFLIKNIGDYHLLEKKFQNLVDNLRNSEQSSWGIISSKNRIQEPVNRQVLVSWNELNSAIYEDRWVSFKDLNTRLRSIPFGNDDFSLTLLYAGWIGFYKQELQFYGSPDGRKGGACQLGTAGIEAKIQKPKDFIKWLEDGNVQIQRPGKHTKTRALQYLNELEKVKDFDKASTLLRQYNEIIDTLSPDDETKNKIQAQFQNIKSETKKIADFNNQLKEIRSVFQTTYAVGELLKLEEKLPKQPESFLTFDEKPFLDFISQLNARLETEAEKYSQSKLERREDYEKIKSELIQIKETLENKGRHDLVKFYTIALERIDKELNELRLRETQIAERKEVDSILQQCSRAKTLQEIQNVTQLIEDTRKIYSLTEDQVVQFNLKKQELENAKEKIINWVCVELMPQISEAWQKETIEYLREQIDNYASLCSSDENLLEKLQQARKILNSRWDLLQRLLLIRNRQLTLQDTDNIRRDLKILKNEYPDAIKQILEIEENVESKISNLKQEERKQIQSWLNKFDLSKNGEITPQRANDLLREIDKHSFNLNSEDEKNLINYRKQLEKVRNADITNQIVDEFTKITDVDQRLQCLLKLVQIYNTEGLSDEYIEKLIQAINLGKTN